MRVRARPIALALVAAICAACDGDAGDASAVSAVAVSPTSAPSTTAVDPACLDGVWAVTALTAQNGYYQFVGPVTGMTMSFGDGTWSLVATASTIYIELRDIPAVATLDGEATGLTTVRGGRLRFQFAAAVGTATAESAGMEREMSFEELLVALGPTGEASITCGPTDAVVATRTTSLQLERDG